MQSRPASVGDAIDDIDTPALVCDLDVFESNVVTMARKITRHGRTLRPHAKAHKCPGIADLQVRAGAIGICCQKISEAEILCGGGVSDVFLTNEIVARSKLDRLCELARNAKIAVCVDSPNGIERLSGAATRHNVSISAFVEIDVGQGRCGVLPGPDVVDLAQAIIAAPHLEFGGLQAYHGKAQHLRTPVERKSASESVGRAIATVRALLANAGVAVPVVSGGGTGTVDDDLDVGAITEIQAGSYIFMDADYALNDIAGSDREQFRQSLFVKASVMSVPTHDRVVIDAGLKSLSVDSGLPILRDFPDVPYGRGGDEHGILVAPGIAKALPLGSACWVVPSHCDTTLNLFDWIVGIRGTRVESVWNVAARGAIS